IFHFRWIHFVPLLCDDHIFNPIKDDEISIIRNITAITQRKPSIFYFCLMFIVQIPSERLLIFNEYFTIFADLHLGPRQWLSRTFVNDFIVAALKHLNHLRKQFPRRKSSTSEC